MTNGILDGIEALCAGHWIYRVKAEREAISEGLERFGDTVNRLAWLETHRGLSWFRYRLTGNGTAEKARREFRKLEKRGAIRKVHGLASYPNVFVVDNARMPALFKAPVKARPWTPPPPPAPMTVPTWARVQTWWLPKHGGECWCPRCNPAKAAH